MIDIQITIAAPQLEAALQSLADALAARPAPAAALPSADPAPPAAPPPETPAPAAPPPETPAPVAPPPGATLDPGPAITMNDLALCGAALVDEGKMDDLVALLAKFGVQAITQLDAGQYLEFAKGLVSLGGQMQGVA